MTDTPVKIMDQIDTYWRGTVGKRDPANEAHQNSRNGLMVNTAYKQLENISDGLTHDLESLCTTVLSDFSNAYELSPRALVELRQVVVGSVACASQLGVTAGMEGARLESYVDPEDTEDHIYDAIADFNHAQDQLIKNMWNEVNN